jgi:transposase
MKELGWTPQIPITRAVQRDEAAIEHWRVDVWPQLRRRAVRERRTLVFIDESGFYLLPGKVKTYGPKGKTPVLDKWLTRDHLSVMAGFTPAGKVYTLVRPESLSSTHSVVFLEHLLRQTRRRLLVIWDGSPIHRWKAVREWLSSGGARRVHLEQLPGYAPDLNPLDAGGWHHLKHVEMRNLSCMDLEELHLELHLAIGRLRQKPPLIHSFFAAAGLSFKVALIAQGWVTLLLLKGDERDISQASDHCCPHVHSGFVSRVVPHRLQDGPMSGRPDQSMQRVLGSYWCGADL